MKRVFTTLLLLFDPTPSVCNHRLNSCCVTWVWTSHMSNQMFMILTLMFSFIIYLQHKSVKKHYLLRKQLYNIMLPTSVLYLVAIYTAWSHWRVSGFMYVVVQSCTVSPRLQNNKVSEFPKQTNNKSEPVGCQHVYHVVYTIFLFFYTIVVCFFRYSCLKRGSSFFYLRVQQKTVSCMQIMNLDLHSVVGADCPPVFPTSLCRSFCQVCSTSAQ